MSPLLVRPSENPEDPLTTPFPPFSWYFFFLVRRGLGYGEDLRKKVERIFVWKKLGCEVVSGCPVNKYLADWSRLEDGAVSGWMECFYLFEEEQQEEEEEGDIFWLVPLLQLFSGLLRLLPERICFAARYFSPLLNCDAWCCHNCKDLQKFWNRAMLLTFGKLSVNLFRRK